jgi:hypothetical protein
MAMQIHARNRSNPRFDEASRTKLESLPQIFRENFCASGGYEGHRFFELFFDPPIIEFLSLAN